MGVRHEGEETLAEVSVFSGLWHQSFLSPKSPSRSQGSGYTILAVAYSPGGDTMTQSGGHGLEAKAQGPPEWPMNVSAGTGKLPLTSTPKISLTAQAVLLSLMSRLAPSWDHSKGHCNLTLCSPSSLGSDKAPEKSGPIEAYQGTLAGEY